LKVKQNRRNSRGIVPVVPEVEMSVAKKRWNVCIKKVLLQNSVQKVTTLLTKLLANKRLPGNDPIMLYSGTKIFWKVNTSLDIQIALHDDVKTNDIQPVMAGIISTAGNKKRKKESHDYYQWES
jgi:hypothetical protein